MRFYPPFDDVQWKAATKHYSDMRAYVYGLRRTYPPNSQESRQLLRRLRQIVQDFARELIKARDRIDTRRLNSYRRQSFVSRWTTLLHAKAHSHEVIMLERLLTPKLCGQVVDLLIKERGWSASRIARRIHASLEFVGRVQRGIQSFEFADIESLAKSCRIEPHLLVFEAMQLSEMSSSEKGLHDLTRKLIESHKQFTRAMRRKPSKRRATRTKAA